MRIHLSNGVVGAPHAAPLRKHRLRSQNAPQFDRPGIWKRQCGAKIAVTMVPNCPLEWHAILVPKYPTIWLQFDNSEIQAQLRHGIC